MACDWASSVAAAGLALMGRGGLAVMTGHTSPGMCPHSYDARAGRGVETEVALQGPPPVRAWRNCELIIGVRARLRGPPSSGRGLRAAKARNVDKNLLDFFRSESMS